MREQGNKKQSEGIDHQGHNNNYRGWRNAGNLEELTALDSIRSHIKPIKKCARDVTQCGQHHSQDLDEKCRNFK